MTKWLRRSLLTEVRSDSFRKLIPDAAIVGRHRVGGERSGLFMNALYWLIW